MTLPSLSEDKILVYFLKNFFLPYAANPMNPEPRSSMVVGSGTGSIEVNEAPKMEGPPKPLG